MAPRFPSIPDPTTSPESLRDSVLAIKQALELLTGQRGSVAAASASDVATVSDTVDGHGDDIASLQDAIAALSYVSSIEGQAGALTLNETSGIENSGSAIQLRQGSASQFGAVKVDDATLQASAGVLSTKNPALSSSSAALGGNVNLSNTANYFDGPSITLGTGTWFVVGTVTVRDTAVTAAIYAKLWDGSTVMASAANYSSNTARGVAITLAGIITNPAAAVKISCRDPDGTTGIISSNQTGNSKDSHIAAVRIG